MLAAPRSLLRCAPLVRGLPRRCLGTAVARTPPKTAEFAQLDDDPFGYVDCDFSKYRPTYPVLFSLALGHRLSESQLPRSTAVDLCTGTGIIADTLAADREANGLGFERVIGVDRSPAMLTLATQLTDKAGVEFLQADVLNTHLEDECCEIVTLGQALHWLPPKDILQEMNRILKPGGIGAIMGYSVPKIKYNPPASKAFQHYYYDLLGSHLPVDAPGNFWAVDRRFLDKGHKKQEIHFFQDVERLWNEQEKHMSVDEFIGYLRTGSAYNNMMVHSSISVDPLLKLHKQLSKSANENGEILVSFPHWMIMGTKHK